MKSQIVQTSSGSVEYVLLGSGPTVLICHGTSSNCFATELVQPLVEAGFSVLTPSRPGYGKTPISVGASAAESARAMVSLLEKLGILDCAVVAISGGGPTGLTVAANYPKHVTRLVLADAISCPEDRPKEPTYKSQETFYGPMHAMIWGMLGLMSRLNPRAMARQTLAIFSTHDPDDGLSKLSKENINTICRFYQGRSSRRGALADAAHTVGSNLLKTIHQPTLVIHSREDNSVPFSHAEWSLKHIPRSKLCEAGITGHFFWVDPDFPRIRQSLITFLKGAPSEKSGSNN